MRDSWTLALRGTERKEFALQGALERLAPGPWVERPDTPDAVITDPAVQCRHEPERLRMIRSLERRENLPAILGPLQWMNDLFRAAQNHTRRTPIDADRSEFPVVVAGLPGIGDPRSVSIRESIELRYRGARAARLRPDLLGRQSMARGHGRIPSR